MGTTWSVRVVGGEAAALQPVIENLLNRLVADLSHWEPSSALCRFNRAPAGSWQTLPSALAEVLTASLKIAEQTGGAFDPTLGALVDLWGFGPPGPIAVPPGHDALAEARARSGWRRLKLDAAGRRAFQPGGLQLDLSGIAKGYAVDRLSALLAASGLPDHLVEIGGELRGSGLKPDGTPWWVALEGPAARAPEVVAALHGLSAATSGEYRRNFVHADRRFGHTLNGGASEPISNGLTAVTVLHPSCRQADAYATALLALGPQRGPAFADGMDLAARFLTAHEHGGGEIMTAAMIRMLA
ncbi:FAD:protein FMN transferase [Methylorubrum extorquens]